MEKRTKVLVGGTFSLLHLGHLFFFEQAKKLGNYLIVVVANDVTLRKSGKPIVVDQDERLELVRALKIVDMAIPGDEEDFMKVVEQHKPDIIALGYDQHFPELKKKLKDIGMSHVETVRIENSKEPTIYKSSKIIERILERAEQ